MSQNPVYSTSTAATAPVDIFSMLSKAQDDFNSIKEEGATRKDSTTSKASDMTSQSVMDFFVSAGSGAAAQNPAISSQSSPDRYGPRSDARDGPLLLQRLMSDPAHSVEHIKKQQGYVTPQQVPGSNDNLNLQSAMWQGSSYQMTSFQKEKQSYQRISAMKTGQTPDSMDNALNPLDIDLNWMHVSSPNPNSSLASFLNQSQDVNHSASTLGSSKIDDVVFYPLMNSPQRLVLKPPTEFTVTPGGDVQPSPEPLTRDQLLQAFKYHLEHDDDFVNKLHEAYVKSFSEKFKFDNMYFL